MSDSNDDPMLAHLRERKAQLLSVIVDNTARLAEVDDLIAILADGRTRVRRRLKGEVVVVLPGNGASDAMPPTDPPAAA